MLPGLAWDNSCLTALLSFRQLTFLNISMCKIATISLVQVNDRVFYFFLDAIIISWHQIPLLLFDGIDKILLKIKSHISYCVVLQTCCMKHDRGKQNCSAKRISRHFGNFWKLLIGINVRCTFNASLNCTKQMTKTIDKHCQRHNGPKSWMLWLVKAIVSTTKTRYTLLTP